MRPNRRLILCAFILILAVAVAAVSVPQQDQPQGGQDQTQTDQQQQQQQQQQKKKKKGGFFGGLKAVTGETGEQSEVTRTAGSKSVGEGEKMGDVQPTAADRRAVKGMEDYSLPQKDVKKFQEDGKLQPQQ